VSNYAAGVWWVDVAALSSPDKVIPSIAGAAQLQLGEGDAQAQLVRSLGSREMLLVLDNCEHLAEPVARIVHTLLAGATGVRVLTTSQEALKVEGEHLYMLSPLAVPPRGVSLATARGFAAVQLLEHRARAGDARFSLTEANVDCAIDLCRQLDGVALAIEMAAARIPVLGLEGLHRRLGERLSLLRTTSREAPSRQRTLRATLDWSHNLLDANERAVLRRLSVFVGSFRLDSARETAAFAGLDDEAVLDALFGLVDKSLVKVEQIEPPRYRLSETTRMFASEKLSASNETLSATQRHGSAMATLAEAMESTYWASTDEAWLSRYALDRDDLQAAFEHARVHRAIETAAETCNALQRLDQLRNIRLTLRNRAEEALELMPAESVVAMAWLWNSCALSIFNGSLRAVSRITVAREALAVWRRLGRAQDTYAALCTLAFESARIGDLAMSASALGEATALEDVSWPARRRTLRALAEAGLAIFRGDPAAYRLASQRELALAKEAGADCIAAWARIKLADSALMAGDCDEAIALSRSVAPLLEALDQPSALGSALSILCSALLLAGDLAGAHSTGQRFFPLSWRDEEYQFDNLALLAARTGRPEISARVLGFTDAWYMANQERRQATAQHLSSLAAEAAGVALGENEQMRIRDAGAAMTAAEAERLLKSLLASGQAVGTI
jgi:predicted ATPase